MNKYIITYEDGSKIAIEAKNSLEVVKKYDLTSKENINAKIEQINN